jgi:hypothetical protein
MEECAASLRRRSSTQVSAHPSTARMMLMSSCRATFFAHSLRFTSRSRCPASRTGHAGGKNPHREVPAWCCQQVLCACTVAHCFALLRESIWRETDGSSAWGVNFERLPLNYVERGTDTSDRPPGVMDQRFAELKDEGNNSDPENWTNAFRTQTGQNINVAANGIAMLASR